MSEIFGIDVSYHQGQMDWAKAKQAGARFAFIRAGSINQYSGALYSDYRLEENAAAAPQHMPVGYYWFFRGQWNAINQANYFCNLLEGKARQLPPVLDVETNDTGLSQSLFCVRVKAALDTIEARTGRTPIIYTSAGKWNPWAGTPTWASRYKLWVAHYTTRPQPYLPTSWADWTLWQFSSDGNGLGPTYGASGSQAIDLDRFQGDETEFQKFTGASINEPLTIEERLGALEQRVTNLEQRI